MVEFRHVVRGYSAMIIYLKTDMDKSEYSLTALRCVLMKTENTHGQNGKSTTEVNVHKSSAKDCWLPVSVTLSTRSKTAYLWSLTWGVDLSQRFDSNLYSCDLIQFDFFTVGFCLCAGVPSSLSALSPLLQPWLTQCGDVTELAAAAGVADEPISEEKYLRDSQP